MAPSPRVSGERVGVRGAALCALLLLACQRAPRPDTVLQLGRREISYTEFQTYLARNLGSLNGGESDKELPSEVLSQLFDQFVEETLLSRLAVDKKLAPEGADSRTAVRELLAESASPPASQTELAAYYEERRTELTRPERVHLRQILVEKRTDAEQALREVRAGADFGEVAKRRSTEPSSVRGGDQGVLARSDLPPAFAEAIFSLAPGQVSDIVPADYGFHLFQVLERHPAQQLSLDEAGPELAVNLDLERRDRRLAELVATARAEYNPVIYEKNLPFNYIGLYASPG